MKRVLPLCLLACGASPAAAGGAFQVAATVGSAPSEPMELPLWVGGFVGVPLTEALSLELEGTWRDGLGRSTELSDFLRDEALLAPDDVLADRTLWTVGLLARLTPLRGKWALLQSSPGGIAFHVGLGGGVRAQQPEIANDFFGPWSCLAGGVDLVFAEHLLVRLDGRFVGALRRDDSIGFAGEAALSLGARL